MNQNKSMPSERDTDPAQGRTATAVACLGLSLLTLLVYAQVGNFEFVSLDDGIFVHENRHVNTGLSSVNAAWAFGIHGPGQWHPLAYLSHQFAFQFFGAGPRPHHLINLAFHIAGSIVLLLALRRMTGQLWPSAFVAAIFALHPLHVASVAWVSERRDVLCAFFWVLTLWAYAAYAERGGLLRYLGVAILFAMALMSKPMAVTLPCVLLLLDFWPLRRGQIPARDSTLKARGSVGGPPPRSWKFLVLEKVPLLGLSAVASVLSILSHTSAVITLETIPLHIRILNAAAAYAVYLRKMVWPSDLACWYPHPYLQPSFSFSTFLLSGLIAGLMLLAVTVFVAWQARSRPHLLVGWFWYLGVLFPVSGLFQVGAQAYLDHFTYLPMIGIYIAVAWSGAEVTSRWPRSRSLLAAVTAVLLLALVVLTSKQIGVWRNSRTLFEEALRVTTENALAECNLGQYYLRNSFVGDDHLAEAKEHLHAALRLRPNDAPNQANVGALYLKLGDRAKAAEHFSRAVDLGTDDPVVYFNLGTISVEGGNLDRAVRYFRDALALDPQHLDSMNNLSVVYVRQERLTEAADLLRSAIGLYPQDPDAHNGLGVVYKQWGDLPRAEEYFRKAVQLDPTSSVAHCNLGDVLLRKGELDEAAAEYFQAIRYQEDFADAYCSLGTVFVSKKDYPNAVRYLERALKINPGLAEAHNNLGAAREEQGQLVEAQHHYQESVRLNPRNTGAHDNLARVTAELARQGPKK